MSGSDSDAIRAESDWLLASSWRRQGVFASRTGRVKRGVQGRRRIQQWCPRRRGRNAGLRVRTGVEPVIEPGRLGSRRWRPLACASGVSPRRLEASSRS
ncbi:hypothetical protein GGTG_00574 [Gaeumannomyces tritici R3-111a-1]|uniref:Uncharacterized protein n=1 Tax=Gaeumannomyces tritici (strain R3-111a-1) TaxID=644352 RepID=J3NH36_GAET3|nr:hypothetical protein GGTG_00574 [Gaeumannomyces tritici R3-111a-1]EJT80579.1 hypothetical protein GGTG_00574 [Gaeumannomyces tritici R3-111a-1]